MRSLRTRAAIAAMMFSTPVLSVAAENNTKEQRAAQAAEDKRLGSHYLRCDGQPNNVTGAESFARFIGAVTLLGLFAPSPEAPDPSKRLFGAKGVEACNWLLERPEGETNGLRRIPLILGRALHQIEAKNYAAAITDVDKARTEAKALGLIGNPYFDRSVGLSLALIEAEARMRTGDPAGAREIGLSNAGRMPYSYYPMLTARPFSFENRKLDDSEVVYLRNRMRVLPMMTAQFAARLGEADRFAEAAAVYDDLSALLRRVDTSMESSSLIANAAVAYALAGNWNRASERSRSARDNMDALDTAGKVENDRSAAIEVLDLYEILRLAHNGKLDDARRNFAARSQWSAPPLGAIMAASSLLRANAKPDQLFGALAATPEQLWTERARLGDARRLELDGNNSTLFSFILPYSKVSAYEGLSGTVWRADKSRLIAKEPNKDSRFYIASLFADPLTQPDALRLHAALVAKARGFKGLIFITLPNKPDVAFVDFVNPNDAGIPATMVLDPDAVIAELRQVIPSPEQLDARRKQARAGNGF